MKVILTGWLEWRQNLLLFARISVGLHNYAAHVWLCFASLDFTPVLITCTNSAKHCHKSARTSILELTVSHTKSGTTSGTVSRRMFHLSLHWTIFLFFFFEATKFLSLSFFHSFLKPSFPFWGKPLYITAPLPHPFSQHDIVLHNDRCKHHTQDLACTN